jgi:hypothetical protein
MTPFEIFANNEAGISEQFDLRTLYRHFTIEVHPQGDGSPVFDVTLEGSVAGYEFEPLVETGTAGLFSSTDGHLVRYVRINLSVWDTSPLPSNSAALHIYLAAGE